MSSRTNRDPSPGKQFRCPLLMRPPPSNRFPAHLPVVRVAAQPVIEVGQLTLGDGIPDEVVTVLRILCSGSRRSIPSTVFMPPVPLVRPSNTRSYLRAALGTRALRCHYSPPGERGAGGLGRRRRPRPSGMGSTARTGFSPMCWGSRPACSSRSGRPTVSWAATRSPSSSSGGPVCSSRRIRRLPNSARTAKPAPRCRMRRRRPWEPVAGNVHPSAADSATVGIATPPGGAEAPWHQPRGEGPGRLPDPGQGGAVRHDPRGQSPDFVTIDIEGHKWPALKGFSLDVWRPAVVLVERNFYPDWRILLHMHRYGYAYTRTTGVNDWFERDVRAGGWEMARAAAPHYRQNVRPMIHAALERLRLLSLAERVHGALRRSP